MARYYVNKNEQSNGDHEVHEDICRWMPEPANRLFVGDHTSCVPAVAAAKKYYPQSNGCAHCSPPCHTG